MDTRELIERLRAMMAVYPAYTAETASIAATTISSQAAEIERLREELENAKGERREIELNLKAKQRTAFRLALRDLPEIAPNEVGLLLSSVHMRDEFMREGKRLQIALGTEAVPPRVEQECGAGAWSFMRAGILAALAPKPNREPKQ